MTFSVLTSAYCGMAIPHGAFDTLEEARDRVAARLRYVRRQGSKPYRLGERQWEITEPEDCLMVPDFCGVLSISEIHWPEDDDDKEESLQ